MERLSQPTVFGGKCAEIDSLLNLGDMSYGVTKLGMGGI